jgi:plasmid stabilization system protein ParE
MKVTYHPSVQRDVNEILRHYEHISGRLADEFWDELLALIASVSKNPNHFHFAEEGLRRANLQKFPYHFLFRALPDKIRITVVRHNKRDPKYALGRK